MMRLNRLTIPENRSHSFDLRHEQLSYFENPWHFHPELELNWIISSSGARFIGDSVERFDSGEIVLLGKNLPHYWKNDLDYYRHKSFQPAEAIITRFSDDFLGEKFINLPETIALQQLFQRAACGLKLMEPLRGKIAGALATLVKKEGFEQLLGLLQILHELATSDALESISPNYVYNQLLIKHNQRLTTVIAYLMAHFTEPISLLEIAELANMNQAAFCRYFKQQTSQTVTQYLTDLRIRYACELLTSDEQSVTQICFQVGFENVSHFIQVFKNQRNQTPLEFRKKMLK
jgi:AraC-like DNA-binding protein